MSKSAKNRNGDVRNEELSQLVLSPEDARHLSEVEKKFQLIRDLTGSVVNGRTTGLYVYGKGGTGKTYTIVKELDRRDVPFKLSNSRMTPRAFFDCLEEFPDDIHLMEDMEQLFRKSEARGLLRS